ncbi:hypothetical protein F4801DRAFT_596445 [Xylaria longipes]|nr:hypothetical protein F4801DRAFT_596445 [Xylaria longipes]RYC62047.1 hypothetical protein CHU98_g4147 [Xylaria longipes]
MAPKSKKPVTETHAGVRKTKKHNKHQTNSQGSHTSATDLPETGNMLVFSEIDFSSLVNNAMFALAMTATGNEIAGSASNPNNKRPRSEDSSEDPNSKRTKTENNQSSPSLTALFGSLPTEILIRITQGLPVEDQIRLALTYPQFFMNDNRLNIFTVDAYHQLDIRTYRRADLPPAEWLDHLRTLRDPLLHDAIFPDSGNFEVDEIEIILQQYERVCIDNQINPNAFLDSDFPNNRPSGVPLPDSGPYVNAIAGMSALHRAVESGRLDIAQHLIQRGANVHRPFTQRSTGLSLTPFEYGIEYGLTFGVNRRVDRARRDGVEEVILSLAYTSNITAFTHDSRHVTSEMNRALFSGMDRLALLLLQRWESLINVDRNSDRYRGERNRILESMLTNDLPMPQSIRFMLDHGGNFRYTGDDVVRSVTLEARQGGNEENVLTALQWEIEMDEEDLYQAIEILAMLAARDANLNVIRPLVNELIRHNHYQGQAHFLHFSIIAGHNSPLTREFLLDAVDDDVLNGEALRVAIRYRDRTTAARIMQRILMRGESLDALPPRQRTAPYLDYEYRMPLTYALAQENYFEAATLLSLGADLNQIPPNIRDRVRVDRDRINTGAIMDITKFIFRGLHTDAYTRPIEQEAEWALDYVFGRLLSDTRYPMPDYVRTRRHENLPLDDPANDSERDDPPEDDPLITGVVHQA